MEIVKWKKNKKNKESGFMIRVNKDEAIRIINTLSTQILSKNPNTGRTQFTTDKQEYFSISVHLNPQ